MLKTACLRWTASSRYPSTDPLGQPAAQLLAPLPMGTATCQYPVAQYPCCSVHYCSAHNDSQYLQMAHNDRLHLEEGCGDVATCNMAQTPTPILTGQASAGSRALCYVACASPKAHQSGQHKAVYVARTGPAELDNLRVASNAQVRPQASLKTHQTHPNTSQADVIPYRLPGSLQDNR